MVIKISNYNTKLNSILIELCTMGARTTRAQNNHVTVTGKYLKSFHLSHVLNSRLELTRHTNGGGPFRQRKHRVPRWG